MGISLSSEFNVHLFFVDRNVEIESYSDPSISYILNLRRMSCTCPDFLKRRSEKPLGSFDRLCKHLRTCIGESDSIDGTPYKPLFDGEHFNSNYLVGENIIIGYTPEREWVNVFTLDKAGDHSGFGYSIDEKRWSYNEIPPNSDDIERVINDYVKSNTNDFPELSADLLSNISKAIDAKSSQKLYTLISQVLLDDIVEDREIQEIIDFFTSNPLLAMVPECYRFLQYLQIAMKDGIIDGSERLEINKLIRAIGKAIK